MRYSAFGGQGNNMRNSNTSAYLLLYEKKSQAEISETKALPIPNPTIDHTKNSLIV